MRERFGNLNETLIPTDGTDDWPLLEMGGDIRPERVRVVFRDLRDALLACIDEFPVAYGCVAWATDLKILDALAAKRAALVIQKEDFLRPDSGKWHKSSLRDAYDRVGGLDRFNFPTPLGDMSTGADRGSLGVRCVGYARQGDLAVPRMHHKFLVFGDICPRPNPEWGREELLIPKAVWTGSFNFTHNGTQSLENAVVIYDKGVAAAYTMEFAQVAALSEPLDWEHEYVAPEWRVGT